MGCPTQDMLYAAYRVLYYLSHHRAAGLRLLLGHATFHIRSCLPLWTKPLSRTWASKKRATVALFSYETEIVAASKATQKAVYLRALLEELGEPCDQATSRALDNKSAIDLAYNSQHHSPTV
eukprot:3483060-Pleurochrysis_carterae.AAC.1